MDDGILFMYILCGLVFLFGILVGGGIGIIVILLSIIAGIIIYNIPPVPAVANDQHLYNEYKIIERSSGKTLMSVKGAISYEDIRSASMHLGFKKYKAYVKGYNYFRKCNDIIIMGDVYLLGLR